MIVYLARDILPFVMYCVNGKPRSSLLIRTVGSILPLVRRVLVEKANPQKCARTASARDIWGRPELNIHSKLLIIQIFYSCKSRLLFKKLLTYHSRHSTNYSTESRCCRYHATQTRPQFVRVMSRELSQDYSACSSILARLHVSIIILTRNCNNTHFKRNFYVVACLICGLFKLPVINPRRALQRVTVVVLCVCMSVTHTLFWQYARLKV